jgi:hypothetical protein
MIWENSIIVKIKGVDEKSQVITIDDDDKCKLLDHSMIWKFKKSKEELLSKYKGREAYAEYLGNSRIDGHPMFKVDLLQLERDDKINEILK